MEKLEYIAVLENEKWKEVFKRLRVQGFGDFFIKDKYVLIRTPFISEPEILAGLLEGLLGIELDIKTFTAPFVFEIKEKVDFVASE